MDIFISWAGRDSRAVALVLREWLPQVLQFVRPWVSSEDIRKGTRWSEELWDRLQKTSYCIVCLTPAAVRSPWVNFEAGAVAKAVGGQAHVSPLLLGLSPRHLDGVPLAMFQCTVFERRDMERLVKAINAVATVPIPESEVLIGFRRGWPVLRDEVGLVDIVSGDDSEQGRSPKDEGRPPTTRAAPPPPTESARSARVPLSYTSPERLELEWIRMNWASDETATKMIEGSRYFVREATRRAAIHTGLRDDYVEVAPEILLRQFIVDCPEAFKHSRFDPDALQEWLADRAKGNREWSRKGVPWTELRKRVSLFAARSPVSPPTLPGPVIGHAPGISATEFGMVRPC